MSIEENVERVQKEIAQAAIAAGRQPEEVVLCAATKMNDAQAVRRAIAAGVGVCGENRVQELTQKLGENAYEGAQIHSSGITIIVSPPFLSGLYQTAGTAEFLCRIAPKILSPPGVNLRQAAITFLL